MYRKLHLPCLHLPVHLILSAMLATGFSPAKLYGSVWQFTPTRLDLERSIQFHGLHPSGKWALEMQGELGGD